MEELEEINNLIKAAEEKLAPYDEKRQNGEILDVPEVMIFSSYLMSLAILHQSRQIILSKNN